MPAIANLFIVASPAPAGNDLENLIEPNQAELETDPVKMSPDHRYTCREYRQEMTLLGLKQRLKNADLSEEERRRVVEDIPKLEAEMGMD